MPLPCASGRHALALYSIVLLVVAPVLYLWPLRDRGPRQPTAEISSSLNATNVNSGAPLTASDSQGSISNSRLLVADPGLHVVIAHYNEEPFYIRTWLDDLRQIPWVQDIGLFITIYTKGPRSKVESIQSITGANSVIQLPNVGREGGSYLHHILEHYDEPPPFTLFTQAYLKKAQRVESGPKEGHLEDWLVSRLTSKFDGQIGFMSLDRKHDICYCGHCTDMGSDEFYPLWPQIYSLLTGAVCQRHEGQILSFNGHFIVSRARILRQPRHIYEYLEELVNAPDDHWIHTEPEPRWFDKKKGKSIPSNPKFGHTLERLWHTLFNCDSPEQVTDCDVVGMKAEGPGGCTCKD